MILSYIWNYFNVELVFPDFTQLFFFVVLHGRLMYVYFRKARMYKKRVSASSVFVPLPAVLTNVTNLVL